MTAVLEDLETLFQQDPASFSQREKSEALLAQLESLTEHHWERSEPYRRVLEASGLRPPFGFRALEDVPAIPVSLFKQFELRSIEPEQVARVLRSSGTTGQTPSRVFLDSETARLQTRALVKIFQRVIGPQRLPMLIIDQGAVVGDRRSFTARGAGVLGLANFGREHTYLLDSEMRVNWEALDSFAERFAGQRVLMFGFTFMVWHYLVKELQRAGRRLPFNDGVLIHSGGWKKLIETAVSDLEVVVFLVAFSYLILNRNIEKWFMVPVEGIKTELEETASSFNQEVQGRADALARWLSSRPDVRDGTANFAAICRDNRIAELTLHAPNGTRRVLCASTATGINTARSQADIPALGTVELSVEPQVDLIAKQLLIDQFMRDYSRVSAGKRGIRTFYLLFILLIALFILYVATWMALLLSRQISGPILALLEGSSQVRKGNLAHRVITPAADEMASLVRAFNEMTQGLEASSRELESRRQFTEAILESIPTGVISLTSDGKIQRVNRAMKALFSDQELEGISLVSDLLTADHTAEVRYLMKRARRTGVASSQIDVDRQGHVLHLAVTVSALPSPENSAPGYVVVVEDTSELLRAQKAAAWHEVARRIAHELKNPLTPIALSAERIARQLDRGPVTPEAERVLRQSSTIIVREVESVKALVDEFSQFSRFPTAQPVTTQLNGIVRNALDVFAGRLEGIALSVDLSPDLPAVYVDPEQLKRVVVNLVDNAAEAMRESMVKRLLVATRATPGDSPDTVELLVADTGRGVSAEDKEKLFLPYFSTKERGTGLGLAIVSHIVAEHGGRIRVEDNRPAGARFYVEIPMAGEISTPDSEILESGAKV